MAGSAKAKRSRARSGVGNVTGTRWPPELNTPPQTLALQPDETSSQDTFVQEANPTGAAINSATIALNGAAAARRNTLLKFDLSALVGKSIVSAKLYLHNLTTSAANQSYPVHRILAANAGWVEGATWNHADPTTVRWAGDAGSDGGTDAGCSVAGTDYAATPLGTMQYVADTAADTEHEIALNKAQFTAMVAANHGLVILKETSGIFSLHSSSAATAAFRPRLVVEYRD